MKTNWDHCVSDIVVPVIEYLQYAISSRKRVRCMIERMKELEDIAYDIKAKVDSRLIEDLRNPPDVIRWLPEVEEIKKFVEEISNMSIGPFNMNLMSEAGRSTSWITPRIEKLITIHRDFPGTWDRVPLGRIRSSGADVFMSRQRPFEDALKLLQRDDNKSQVIALYGMGGVGKSTMMDQLIQVANDKKLFNFIVRILISRHGVNIYDIQFEVVAGLGLEGLYLYNLEGISTRARAIHNEIKKMLAGGTRILIILDGVLETHIDLKDLGIERPMPKGIKVMITSCYEVPCRLTAYSVGSVVQFVPVSVLDEREAQILFFECIGVSTEYFNSDQYHIGCDIVKKCGGLPFAITNVASDLRDKDDRHSWEYIFSRFNKGYFHFIDSNIFWESLDNLQVDGDKEIFMHCGLFPKDYDISIEYLARYAWGLKLLRNVFTLRAARERTKKCVHNLIVANLLMSSNHFGCVKMNNVANCYVLNRVSKGNPVWTIKHGDVSDWETSESCTEMSLTCSGPSSKPDPAEFKHPECLKLLQLMHGDMCEFPEDFYEGMKNLKVLACYKMHHPLLLPRRSTSLTTLSLHECTLESDDDYSLVGDLLNLEVLSFAHCGIRKLPSTIGNLKRLKLLDLTGCVDLQIDDGVFLNLHNLEELYMRVSNVRKAAIRFTDSNWEEFKILVKQLYALEAEFVEKKTGPENLSFNRLGKFKISIGCLLDEDEDDQSSFTNTLKIATKSGNDILESQINKLFMDTHKLHLQVHDMIGLEKIVSFYNVRDLTVSNCAELKYVFPIHVASGLSKLERLKVSSCSVLETLVCSSSSSSNNESEITSEDGDMVKFEALKFLCLENLPKLVSLFHVDIVVELPQLVELEVDGLPNFTSISALLNTQVKIRRLEKLKICHMEKLKQILTSSSEEEGNNVSMLKEIKVLGCNSLVHLFPTNPMKLLIHLERLEVSKCGSVGEIFNIDLECVGHEIEQVIPSLRRIRVDACDNLVNLFPTNPMGLFNQLEEVEVDKCGSIKEIFSIDLRHDRKVKHAWNNLRRIRVRGCDSLVNLFPTIPMEKLRQLEEVEVEKCGSIKEIFSIDLGRDGDVEEAWNHLRRIRVRGCDSLVDLFPTGFLELLINLEELQVENCGSIKEIFNVDLGRDGKGKPVWNRLRRIRVEGCDSLVNLFPINQMGKLNQLEEVEVEKCGSIKEIFSIDLGRDGEVTHAWKNLRRIRVRGCDGLVDLFPTNLLGLLNYLEELQVEKCGSIKEIFNIDFGHDGEVKDAWNRLRRIRVAGCDSLVNLFPTNTMRKLKHLEEVEIEKCSAIKEIFNIDLECDGEVVHAWNSLKRLCVRGCDSLVDLFPSNLLGFIMNHLEELEVEKCGSIKEIFNTDVGSGGELRPAWRNLRRIRVKGCDSLVNIFPTNLLGILNQLEEVEVSQCGSIKEIFSIDLGRGGDFPQVKSLRTILVDGCDNLVSLFSTDPVRLVSHLDELKAKKDGSIKLIFDIDLDLVSQIEQLSSSSSSRSVEVFSLEKVKEVWRLNGGENNSSILLIPGFKYLERIKVEGCKGFKSLFVPTDTRFKMKALTNIAIKDCEESGRNMELVEVIHDKEIKFLSSKERDDYNVSSAAFPPNFTYHRYFDVEMVIEIENQSNRNNGQPLLPNVLGHSNFSLMERMSHMWKCSNWNDFLYLQKQHQQSSFHNLTTIRLRNHKNIKYLISSDMAKLLSNLKAIQISLCDDMKKVVLNEDEKRFFVSTLSAHTTTNLFPRLHVLSFEYMINLKHIGGVGVPHWRKPIDTWSLCEYSRDIHIHQCNALKSVIPSYAVARMQKLEVLTINHCASLMDVFDTTALAIRMPSINVPQLTNLKKLVITSCGLLQHVFTFSTLKSLWNLEELTVSDCEKMKVIVKKENGEQENGAVQVFRCLKLLKLFNLPNLEGFFLGENGFQWPLLENVMVSKCPQMKMFTFGQSTAPELKYIHTSLGKHSLECGLNFRVTTDSHQTSQPPSLEQTSLHSMTMKQLPWSFCNLIELNMTHCWKVKNMVSANNLLQLHKLENIRVHSLFYVEEVFEVVAIEDAESDFKITTLKQVELKDLFSLKYIWKINPRITLLLPNLTTMFVDNCNSLQHVFTSSMVGSLLQLQVLHISNCLNMKVVVKVEEEEEEDDSEEEEEFEFDGRVKQIVLPSLKSLTLVKLKSLTGFCLGQDSFSLPALHTLEIKECPEITGFTNGDLDTPTDQHCNR